MFIHQYVIYTQILYDLSKKEGKEYSIKDSNIAAEMYGKKEFINRVRGPQNFFKHADRDHKDKLLFRYKMTHIYLFDTVRMYILLRKEEPCFEITVFLVWFKLMYSGLENFFSKEIERYLEGVQSNTKNPEEFKMFGRELLNLHDKKQIDNT